MAEDPFSSFIGGYVQAKELERQRMMDVVETAMQKQQMLMEQRRLNIEQSHYDQMYQQNLTMDAIRAANERRLEDRDVALGQYRDENLLLKWQIAQMQDAGRRYGVDTRARTAEEGMEAGMVTKFGTAMLGGGTPFLDVTHLPEYVNQMMSGIRSQSGPPQGGTPTAPAETAPTPQASETKAPPATGAPAAQAPSILSSPLAMMLGQTPAGPKGSAPPASFTKPLPAVEKRMKAQDLLIENRSLTNAQKKLDLQIKTDSAVWTKEYDKAKALNEIDMEHIHALQLKALPAELEARLKILQSQIVAEAQLAIERTANARSAAARAGQDEMKLRDMERAGDTRRYHNWLNNIDPNNTRLKEAQNARTKDKSTYTQMLGRYQLLLKRQHELKVDVDRYAFGDEKDDTRFGPASLELTKVQKALDSLDGQMKQTLQSLDYDNQTVSFWEHVQRDKSTGPNNKDTKNAKEQAKKQMQANRPGTVPSPPGHKFPRKPDGSLDYDRFSQQDSLEYFNMMHKPR